jgi:HlyD family secretion protein
MPNGRNHGSFFARHRGWLIALAIAAAVVVLAAFVSLGRSAVPVRAVHVRRGTIRSLISTNGKIEPLTSFESHAPAPAQIKRVLIHEGDHVKAGQLLLELDPTQAQAQAARAFSQVRTAEAEIAAVQSGGTREEVLTTQSELVKAKTDRDAAQRNLDAMRRLQEKGAAAPGEVRDAENQLARADAQYNLLQQKLQDRYSHPEVAKVQAQLDDARSAYSAAEDVLHNSLVRSTVDGIAYALPVHPGMYVGAGDLLVQVADLSKVQVRAFVDEPDVGRLAPGEPVEISWDAVPGRLWKGTVSRTPSELKMRGTRNVGEVTCDINNRDLKLLPNVNVNVTIVTAQHSNVVTLPREAVHQDDDHPYIFEIVGGELKRRDVRVGTSNLTMAEIAGGISDTAEVALGATNTQPLRDGMQVRVVR